MTKRILIATTSHDKKGTTGQPTGAYLGEIAHPWEVFTSNGYEVEFASVRGGPVPLDGVADKDAVGQKFLESPAEAALHASTPSAKVDSTRYDAIFFAGGHGTMWDLPDDPGFARVTREIWERGGIVSAVCHGPAGLVNVKLSDGSYLVAGKDVTVFTDEEEKAVGLDGVVPFLLATRFAERGARVHGGPMWKSKVSVSDRLVTGQNPASAADVAKGVVELLASR